MKKKFVSFAICLAFFTWSCNDNNSSGSTTGSDSANNNSSMNNSDSLNTMKGAGDSSNNNNTNATNTNTTTASSTPLSKSDSMFIMEAAMGGMMEVQSGNIAQQNAASPRVKSFGAMMVADHSKANDELKSYASSHGIMIPSALPADKQKHIDAMQKMTGKAFDQHYVSMMVDDHKMDIAKFKKESQSGGEAGLKTWAGNTIPTLQKHMDSIMAIKKGM